MENDCMIAPPKQTAILFNQRFMAARYEDGCIIKAIFRCFHVCKRLSCDDLGVARGSVTQEIRLV